MLSFEWMYRRIFVLIVGFLILGGCGSDLDSQMMQGETLGEQNAPESLTEITPEQDLVAIAHEGNLVVYDLESGLSKQVYAFENNMPSRLTLDTFKVSPANSHVVWYQPGLGIQALDLTTGSVAVVYQPSEWFNTNPYFEMDQDRAQISLIDNNGEQFYQIDLTTLEVVNEDIPFPYGTIFHVSPDKQKRVFVAGFGQSGPRPEYLLVADGRVEQFITQAELSDRDKLAWTPDSNGVLVIEEGGMIVLYSLDDLTQGEVLLRLDEGDRAVNLEVVDERLWIQLADGSWKIRDLATGQSAGEVAISAFDGLNSPRIMPRATDGVVVEEKLDQFDEQFNRLWLSDIYGIRQVIIPEYYRIKRVGGDELNLDENNQPELELSP